MIFLLIMVDLVVAAVVAVGVFLSMLSTLDRVQAYRALSSPLLGLAWLIPFVPTYLALVWVEGVTLDVGPWA